MIPAPGPHGQVLVARTDHERMPARFAARFESDEILMTQLVDDLPRGRRCVRPACWPRTTWPPVQAARSLSGPVSGDCVPGPRRNVGRRVVDRRDDAEDVDRHVDRAGDAGHFARRQPAGVVVAVGEDHDRAAAAVACARRAQPFGRSRRAATWRRTASPSTSDSGSAETARERRDLVEPGVEREDRRLVRRSPASSGDAAPPRARRRIVPSMLPLTSNSRATLTPARSRRKSLMGRGSPPSRISKSRAVRSLHETALSVPHHGGHAGRDRRRT